MKLTDRLLGDHKTFRKMLHDIDEMADAKGSVDRSRLIRLVELFKDHLLIHAWVEDNFYYPAIREKLSQMPPPISPSYMEHLDDEHKTVDQCLDRLEQQVKLPALPHHWRQTYALFSKGLVSHMRKEEEELFPISETTLGPERLEDLSRQLERRRSEAPAIRPHSPL